MKKTIVWLLVAVLAVSLAGCFTAKQEEPVTTTDVPATEVTETTAVTEPLPEWDITWKKAFRSDKYPDGGLTTDEVAFAKTEEDGISVENVPLSELIGFDDEGYLPRYSLLQQEESDRLDLTQECISYALLHGCDRFVLPVNTSTMHIPNDREYWWSVDISCDINRANHITLDDGSTVDFALCVIKTPLGTKDFAEWNKEQAEAFAAAKQIIADMPKNCVSDYDKVLYFYRYLTDHVRYAYESEYPGDDDYYTGAQNLYYDTLISHKTVCAGYGKTFAWLCELAGLPAFPATGQYGATEAHLWTMVKVDDGYYWFDPTWDEGSYPEYYQYFGISDQVMEERGGSRHLYQAYEELLPDCPESLPQPIEGALALQRGTVRDRRYQNEDFGLIWDAPDGWRFLSDILIGQGNGESLTPFETLLADDYSAYDMYAVNANGEEVSVEVYRMRMDPSDFADLLLTSLNYKRMNGANSGEKTEVSFCGQTCQSVKVSTSDERVICMQFIILPLDDAILLIRAYSSDLERCAQLLDRFSAIGE